MCFERHTAAIVNRHRERHTVPGTDSRPFGLRVDLQFGREHQRSRHAAVLDAERLSQIGADRHALAGAPRQRLGILGPEPVAAEQLDRAKQRRDGGFRRPEIRRSLGFGDRGVERIDQSGDRWRVRRPEASPRRIDAIEHRLLRACRLTFIHASGFPSHLRESRALWLQGAEPLRSVLRPALRRDLGVRPPDHRVELADVDPQHRVRGRCRERAAIELERRPATQPCGGGPREPHRVSGDVVCLAGENA